MGTVGIALQVNTVLAVAEGHLARTEFQTDSMEIEIPHTRALKRLVSCARSSLTIEAASIFAEKRTNTVPPLTHGFTEERG
jgi:hypothetical protein